MRARGNGWIVNVSSVAGLIAAPGFGYYSATKFAVEAVTDALRDEVAAQGTSVLTAEPGAFRPSAYAGFANEPITETIPEYHDMLAQVRASFVEQDGTQPGDPRRGVRAVIAAMAKESPPHRLVLGSGGYDAVTDALEQRLVDIRANEILSRGADYPV
jgi:NAD(P)-dependent dehydrogenase (short-subunit alcohol dehydrogenase family)